MLEVINSEDYPIILVISGFEASNILFYCFNLKEISIKITPIFLRTMKEEIAFKLFKGSSSARKNHLGISVPSLPLMKISIRLLV